MQDPKRPVRIFDGVHWVGALNPELRRFDVIMETEYGTSYNAYIVQGESKTALIDTVKDGFFQKSLLLMLQLVDVSQLDYIILQHTEPDHSGSIAELAALAPNAQILCSKPASLYLPHIANRELNIKVVQEGDTLDLGGRELRFISAPFLHWPDTMFTYDSASGALFTCDAFGCHYAAENILESKTDETFKLARRYYYDCIVAPFAPFVTKAIAHVNELKLPHIAAILPSHGPVLDKDPLSAIALYHEWARENAPLSGDTVFIGYVTCYGYTRLMAEKFRDRLLAKGAKVDMADFTSLTAAEAAARITAADIVAIGCPTVNADALPPVWEALAHVPVPLVRGRKAVVFGSFGWSGEAVPMLEQRLSGLAMKVLGTVKGRFCPDDATFAEMEQLAETVAAELKL